MNDSGRIEPDATLSDTLQEQAAQLECLLPRLMRRLFSLDREHPATELPLAQLRVCTILQAGPRTLSAISEELGISVSATTQIADRLERSGMVERTSGLDDRRTKQLQLSAYGRDIMRSRRELRTQGAANALEQLSLPEREMVLQAIRALLEAADLVSPPVGHEDPLSTRQISG